MNKLVEVLIKLQLLSLLLLAFPAIAAQEHDEEEEPATGMHGGRLLAHDDFAVELAIFEQGVPPEYRAWAFSDDEEIAAGDWQLNVRLTRLGGQVDDFSFSSTGDYLSGDGVVAEPHSFDVLVSATYRGRTHTFEYESYEGRSHISSPLAASMGIGVHIATAQTLHQTELLYGKISPDPKQVSHITARYPGLIKSVYHELGDSVSAGELIATVEANDSLQTYEITAPISGTVVDSHANPGEYAGEQHLLTIANYQDVYADLNVFPGQAQRVRAGQEVSLRMGELTADSSIRYLNPGEGLSPHVIARVPVANPELVWTPGLLVEADVTVDRFEVPLAVDNRALQQFRDWQVVFIQIGDDYEIRPLELGRRDARFTEVLSGLNPGDRYVVENSYLIKADIEKSGATHSH